MCIFMLTEAIIRKMEFSNRMPYNLRLPNYVKYNNLVTCKRQWLSPMLTAGVLTATFKIRVVTIQFECAHFNVGSNMLVCVVSHYIV